MAVKKTQAWKQAPDLDPMHTNKPGSTTEIQENEKEMQDLDEVVVAASDVHSTPHPTMSSEAAASLINDNLDLKKRLMQAKNIIESYSRRLQKYKDERDNPSIVSVEMVKKIELEVQEKTNRLLAKERTKVEIEIKQQIEMINKKQLAEKITQLEVEMKQKNKEANKQLLAREMENIRDVLKKESKVENGRLLAEERSRMETKLQKKFDNDSNMNMNNEVAAEKDRESQEMNLKLLQLKRTIDNMTKEHAIAVDALKAEHETSTAANKKSLSMRHLFQKNAAITKEHAIEVDMLTAQLATALAENKRMEDEFQIERRKIEQEKEDETRRWEEREQRQSEATAEALQKQLQKQEVKMTATMAASRQIQAKKYQDKIEQFKIAARDAAKATEEMEILQNQLREQFVEKDTKISTLQDCVEVLKEEHQNQMQVLAEQHEKNDQWMLESQEFQKRTKQRHQLELQTVRKQSQRRLDSCVFTHKKNFQLLNEEREQEKTRMLNEIILMRETHEKELMNVETKNQLNNQHLVEAAHLSQEKETDRVLSMASHKFLQWQQRMERMRVVHKKEMRKKDEARMEAEDYIASMEAAAIKNVAQLREDIKQEMAQETQRVKEETVAAVQRVEEAARINFLEREIHRYGITNFLFIPPRQQSPVTEQKGVPKEEEKAKSTMSEVRQAEVFNSSPSKNVADFLYCPAQLH